MNIFVGNLAREATQDDLRDAFSPFGQVASATVIKDKFTGDPRGFGFVEMPSQTEAEAAMSGVKEIKGRPVTVNEARPREDRPRGGFGGGGFNKNRGGGGGRDRDRGPRRGGW